MMFHMISFRIAGSGVCRLPKEKVHLPAAATQSSMLPCLSLADCAPFRGAKGDNVHSGHPRRVPPSWQRPRLRVAWHRDEDLPPCEEVCLMRLSTIVSLACVLSAPAFGSAEPDIRDTRLLSQPAASANHVAFIYADDLWIAGLDGKNVRRLTSDVG